MIGGRRVGVFTAELDGHLAEPNDGLDFLASVQREDEDYGRMAFASRVVGYVGEDARLTWLRNCVVDCFPMPASGPYLRGDFHGIRPFRHGRRDLGFGKPRVLA